MLTYPQLTPTQQAKAVEHEINQTLRAITEGAIRFNDKLNNDNLQARIDAAQAEAEARRTPWFAGEYIMDACRDEITGIGQCAAEDALYLEPGEYVSTLHL